MKLHMPGADPAGGDWGARPATTLESNFIYHDILQFGKQHSQYNVICCPLFCHRSLFQYTSPLLQ